MGSAAFLHPILIELFGVIGIGTGVVIGPVKNEVPLHDRRLRGCLFPSGGGGRSFLG
jgi:hypothetical protein